MTRVAGFVGELVVRLRTDVSDARWTLQEPLSFVSATTGLSFTAAPGFSTDFCTVPRIPFAYDVLGNRARRAGTIHDWLYAMHDVDRATADRVLREMLMLDNIQPWETWLFYWAVRMFGWAYWQNTSKEAR